MIRRTVYAKESVSMRYTMPAELAAWVRERAEHLGVSASQFVEALLEAERERRLAASSTVSLAVQDRWDDLG